MKNVTQRLLRKYLLQGDREYTQILKLVSETIQSLYFARDILVFNKYT